MNVRRIDYYSECVRQQLAKFSLCVTADQTDDCTSLPSLSLFFPFNPKFVYIKFNIISKSGRLKPPYGIPNFS